MIKACFCAGAPRQKTKTGIGAGLSTKTARRMCINWPRKIMWAKDVRVFLRHHAAII